MKKYLALFLFFLSSYSWGCILLKGDIQINEDKLKVHQKIKINETYPYKTRNFLVHLKIQTENVAHIQILHPKTLKILIEKKVLLPFDKLTPSETLKESQDARLKLFSQLILKQI